MSIQEFDTIRLTGTVDSGTPETFQVEKLLCMVSLPPNKAGRFKAWPIDQDDPQLPPDCDGKLYGNVAECKLEIIEGGK